MVLPFMISLIVVAGKYNKSRTELKQEQNSVYTTTTDPWVQFEAKSDVGVVATDVAKCSEVGRDIMKMHNGNAVDAAVASALCLGVLNPSSSGIGGGCFIVHYSKEKGVKEFYDSRETAPAAATSAMFDDNPTLSVNGGLAIATLGEVKGLYMLHSEHGSISWFDVVMPAANIAKRWTISAHMSDVINNDAKGYIESGEYPELTKLFTNDNGDIKTEGDVVENPILAQTLENIAKYGSDYIYDTMAASIAKDVQEVGGILTEEDIRGYQVRTPEPVLVDVLGHTLLSASGSSSGGAAVAGIVNFMEGYEEPMPSQGLLYDHRLVEAMKHAFAIRLSLGDPDFVNTTGPISALLDKEYMGNLRSITKDGEVLDIDSYGGVYNLAAVGRRLLPEDHGTTHLSVVDKYGNAVGLTSTVNTDFGSKVISPSTGIVMNNQMDDFSNAKAANYYGLHPSPYNYPEAGKRPLSSMSPSILLDKDGGVRMVGGASGGPRIITATVQVLLRYMYQFGDLLSAEKSPRLHSQLVPDTVYVEDHLLVSGLTIVAGEETVQSLQNRGHDTTVWGKSMGVSQYIAVDPDTNEICGVSDPRKDGQPAGV
jgi:gamma-glutamyltranspeptidase/glutathione hydrolase/leukotriene-C4 hydrolase